MLSYYKRESQGNRILKLEKVVVTFVGLGRIDRSQHSFDRIYIIGYLVRYTKDTKEDRYGI